MVQYCQMSVTSQHIILKTITYLPNNSPPPNPTSNTNHSPLPNNRPASLNRSTNLDSDVVGKHNGAIILRQENLSLRSHVAYLGPLVDNASPPDRDAAA